MSQCLNTLKFYVFSAIFFWDYTSNLAIVSLGKSSFCIHIFKFIYFEGWGREYTQAEEGQRDGEMEFQAGFTPSAQGPMQGLNSPPVRS